MSILNEREILYRLLVTRDLVITPLVDLATQLGPTSLDVRLGTHFQAQKRSALAYIEPLQDPDLAEVKGKAAAEQARSCRQRLAHGHGIFEGFRHLPAATCACAPRM